MDASIALSTQTIVLPEAGSPKILGRASRSLGSKILLPSPCISIRDRRDLKDQTIALSSGLALYTTCLSGKQLYHSHQQPTEILLSEEAPASSPSVFPHSWAEVLLGDETMRSWIWNWREFLPLEILLFCQESLTAVCASCGSQSCSSGAIRCILWVLLPAKAQFQHHCPHDAPSSFTPN